MWCWTLVLGLQSPNGAPYRDSALNFYKTPRLLSSPPWPSLLISSLQRLPGSTGRGLGPDFTSAKVENLPFLSRGFFSSLWCEPRDTSSLGLSWEEESRGWGMAIILWWGTAGALWSQYWGHAGLWGAAVHPCLACLVLLAWQLLAEACSSCLLQIPREVPWQGQLWSGLMSRFTWWGLQSSSWWSPPTMQGRGSSQHFPSSSDQAASTVGFYYFSRLSFHLLRVIPECLSNTRAFTSHGQPFTLATGSFPFPTKPPSWESLPSTSSTLLCPKTIRLHDESHSGWLCGTHTGHHPTQVISTLPLETSHPRHCLFKQSWISPGLVAASSQSLELLHVDTLRVPERKPSPLPTRGLILGRSQKQAGRGW